MSSEHANEIIKDINEVRKNLINIDCLLNKYHEKSEKDFIQKYAETEIACSSKNITTIAFLFSIASIIIAVIALGPSLFPESFKPYLLLFGIILLVYLIAFILIVIRIMQYLFFPRKDIFKDIIIEIQANNMQNNMQTKSIVISKLDLIIPIVEAINPRIDEFEKKVGNKIESIDKELVSIKIKVDAINLRIDEFQKNVSNKLESIEKEIMSIKSK